MLLAYRVLGGRKMALLRVVLSPVTPWLDRESHSKVLSRGRDDGRVAAAGGQTREPPGGSTLFYIIPSLRFLRALARFRRAIQRTMQSTTFCGTSRWIASPFNPRAIHLNCPLTCLYGISRWIAPPLNPRAIHLNCPLTCLQGTSRWIALCVQLVRLVRLVRPE